jgi:hypothetical protein
VYRILDGFFGGNRIPPRNQKKFSECAYREKPVNNGDGQILLRTISKQYGQDLVFKVEL